MEKLLSFDFSSPRNYAFLSLKNSKTSFTKVGTRQYKRKFKNPPELATFNGWSICFLTACVWPTSITYTSRIIYVYVYSVIRCSTIGISKFNGLSNEIDKLKNKIFYSQYLDLKSTQRNKELVTSIIELASWVTHPTRSSLPPSSILLLGSSSMIFKVVEGMHAWLS